MSTCCRVAELLWHRATSNCQRTHNLSWYRQFMGASSSSNMTSLTTVTVPAKDTQTGTIIFLHGLGDTGHGWASNFEDFSLKHVKCLMPNAPVKPVSLNAGMQMPSWFDIKGLGPDSPEDTQGIKDSSKELQKLVEQEVKKGIPPERIIIGGFSQGGAVALYTAFATNTKVGGVLALSTWLPQYKYFIDESTTKYNTKIPVLQCHGNSDPMVPAVWGKKSSDIVKTFCPALTFKTYNGMGHSSSPAEMKDVVAFLKEVLNES